ncbi:hypothetical protein ACWFQ8_25480 [Streptomyces sp. NPDC055254]
MTGRDDHEYERYEDARGHGRGRGAGPGSGPETGTASGSAPGGGFGLRDSADPGAFELSLRERLADGAGALHPGALPYPAIVRQGRRMERRRRLAAVGAALVVLAVVPAAAVAFSGNGGPAESASVADSGPEHLSPTPPPAPAPTGPTPPATAGQLVDGITLQQAAGWLEECLEIRLTSPSGGAADLGKAADYRILLAQRSTGNDNSPGDGHFVVAVKDRPKPTRLICTIKNGAADGIKTSVGADRSPESGAVVPDMNGGSLYLQRFASEGAWRLPYRWGSIGTVDSRVAKVTVGYGGATVEAALDHGWFAATGVLERRVTAAPRIKGFDAQGVLVYDSDQDRSYDKALP